MSLYIFREAYKECEECDRNVRNIPSGLFRVEVPRDSAVFVNFIEKNKITVMESSWNPRIPHYSARIPRGIGGGA